MTERFLFPVISVGALEPYPRPHWIHRRSDDPRPGTSTHPLREPELLRLSGAMNPLDVGAAIAEICHCAFHDRPIGADASDVLRTWIDSDSRIVAGGIEAVLPRARIEPGCCCGLETWREWTRFADGGDPPWWGHDMDGEANRVDGRIVLSQRGESVAYDVVDVQSELRAVARDLDAFVERAADWSRAVAPDIESELRASLRSFLSL